MFKFCFFFWDSLFENFRFCWFFEETNETVSRLFFKKNVGGLIKQITGNNDMKGKKNLGKEKWTSRIRQKSENIKERWVGRI